MTDQQHMCQDGKNTEPILIFLLSVGFSLSFLFFIAASCWGLASVFEHEAEGQQSVRSGVSMRILWRISEYKIGASATMEENEAQRMLFKPLNINEGEITFDDQTCRDVTFKKEIINAKEYLESAYGITPQALGIEEKAVEIVKTNCNLPGFESYIRLIDRRLIINIKGVFFFFEPVVNY